MSARAATPPSGKRQTPSVEDIDAAIVRLAGQVNSATFRLLVLVREFDDRLGWARWSFPNCSEWLAWRCGLSLSAAREKMRTAHALRALPAISAAFGEGRLSYSKVRALTRVANTRNEDLLLAYALEATAAQVEERSRQMRNVEPDSVDVARRAWERRSLTVIRNQATGMATVTLEVPIEDGEVFVNAVDRAVESGKSRLGPEFEASGWRAQQADAVIEMAKAFLGSGKASPRACAADHYQVLVHVDESALRGGEGRADLPIESVRRLSCDGSLTRIVEQAGGTPLDIGRRQRVVPAPLRRALWSRDRGCSFPGCERTRFVDAHHIEHWADGGDTALDNLTLLCTQHHRLLHEGGFRIGRDTEGGLVFERSDGRLIPRGGYCPDNVRDAYGAADSDLDAVIEHLLAQQRIYQGSGQGRVMP